MQMRIHFLGTGGAIPSKTRENASLLIESEDSLLLVDCSGTPFHSILKAQCDPRKLHAVILTHAHVDHIYGLPSLVHSIWLQNFPNKQGTLKFYGLESTLGYAEKLIDVFELGSKKGALIIEYWPLDGEKADNIGLELRDWEVYSCPVTHGTIPTVGLYFQHRVDNTRIVYSGDSIVDDKIIKLIDKNTKILIHDCGGGVEGNRGHAGAKDIRKIISKSSIKELYLIHLSEDDNSDKVRTIQSFVSMNFKGKVFIPNDGDTISF